jgi:hypothetical protein
MKIWSQRSLHSTFDVIAASPRAALIVPLTIIGGEANFPQSCLLGKNLKQHWRQ